MPALTWLSKCDEHNRKLADHRDCTERANYLFGGPAYLVSVP